MSNDQRAMKDGAGKRWWLKVDLFLMGMAMAVGLAFAFPGPGAKGGWMQPEVLTKAGVALIFFLHGVVLSFASLKAGTLLWRLHLVVQGTTFLLFPLLGWVLLASGGRWLSDGLAMGVFFLCALPSTVSSSVALTAAARGNVPAAVFNATLSSLLGVFLTPLWVGWMLKAGGQGLALGGVLLDLITWLILPLVAGQVLRPWLASWLLKRKAWVHKIDRGTILMLVYTSFCDSVVAKVWSQQSPVTLLGALAGCAGLFFLVMAIVGRVCDRLGFSREDRIAAVFCGSKKTLASGVPMAQLIFAGHPAIGLILLPIMIYHPLQLIICGVLAGRWAKSES